MRFVDTNLLLYCVSKAPGERRKAERSLEILDQGDVVLSVQVLEEFYVQATRSSRKDRISHEQAVLLIESWLRFRVQELTVEILQNALSTCARFRISFWDAAVVEAARKSGCAVILSEDMRHGMNFAGVRIENPFR
jgi:predicted nucleic acid-binding protein